MLHSVYTAQCACNVIACTCDEKRIESEMRVDGKNVVRREYGNRYRLHRRRFALVLVCFQYQCANGIYTDAMQSTEEYRAKCGKYAR